jgi:hypothetical protein
MAMVFSSRLAKRANEWPPRQARSREGDLNEAARAADASREANGAVYGERLK